jgi:hypothetical protein
MLLGATGAGKQAESTAIFLQRHTRMHILNECWAPKAFNNCANECQVKYRNAISNMAFIKVKPHIFMQLVHKKANNCTNIARCRKQKNSKGCKL